MDKALMNGSEDINPLVSVVVPVYNVEDYLKQCVESILGQTYRNLEIILVDDGSTDSSGNIADEFKRSDRRIKVLHKANGGLSDARNFGTEVATGEWLFYVDSDDYLIEGAIRKLLDAALLYDCDIVQCGCYYRYETFSIYRHPKGTRSITRREAMGKLIANDEIKNFAWGKLYRAHIAKKHQFIRGRYFEDSFWQHLMIDESKNYCIVDEPLYVYRQRSFSISGTFSPRILDLIKGNIERVKFIRSKYPEYEDEALKKLWRLAHGICVNGKSKGYKEFETCWKQLNDEFGSGFKHVMRHESDYIAYQLGISKLYSFFMRVVNHFSKSNWVKIKNDEY